MRRERSHPNIKTGVGMVEKEVFPQFTGGQEMDQALNLLLVRNSGAIFFNLNELLQTQVSLTSGHLSKESIVAKAISIAVIPLSLGSRQ